MSKLTAEQLMNVVNVFVKHSIDCSFSIKCHDDVILVWHDPSVEEYDNWIQWDQEHNDIRVYCNSNIVLELIQALNIDEKAIRIIKPNKPSIPKPPLGRILYDGDEGPFSKCN